MAQNRKLAMPDATMDLRLLLSSGGYLRAVRTENGPEFISRAFMAWAGAHGVRHILIEPGRSMQNGYIETTLVNAAVPVARIFQDP